MYLGDLGKLCPRTSLKSLKTQTHYKSFGKLSKIFAITFGLFYNLVLSKKQVFFSNHCYVDFRN